jgi:arylsulfatase A-like enzyme
MTPAARPNVVLLVLDALRADATEPYGARGGASPALAALAARGGAIADVRSTANWTLPSHTAMFTGQLARGLGLGQAPAQTPQSAAPVIREQRERLLAEVLRQAGYATRGVTTNLWAGRVSGFATGFEDFRELDTSRNSRLGGGWRDRLRWDWEGARSRGDDGAAEAATVMEQWLSEGEDRPFFWFANVVECHSPYLPPRPVGGLSPIERLRAADEAYRYLTFEAIMKSWLGALEVPRAAIERMRRFYAASVLYADQWVARVVAALERFGVLENTLIIICSDHGENLGENGLLTHGQSLDERLLHVPFIVAGPGAEHFREIRSLVQLPERVARAAGLEQHPWNAELPAGLPVAQWDPPELSEERIAELRATWSLDAPAVTRLRSPLTCAVSGRWKLTRGAGDTEETLHDLEADPLEQQPITGLAIAARAGGELEALRAAVRHPAAQLRETDAPPPDEVSAQEVADIEERMRLMGYM